MTETRNSWQGFYWPQWPLYPIIAVCAATNPIDDESQNRIASAPYVSNVPLATSETSLYRFAGILNEQTQLRILGQFASQLIVDIVDAPQGAINAINARFWDII